MEKTANLRTSRNEVFESDTSMESDESRGERGRVHDPNPIVMLETVLHWAFKRFSTSKEYI